MTAQSTLAPTPELTPLAEFLAGVLNKLRPLPPIDMDLTQSYGNVLAEEVRAPTALPAFDHATIDGYAARSEDILGAAAHRPVRLNVVGDLGASSWRPVRVAPGTCFSVASGAPLPAAADVVVPPEWTDQGMAAVEIREQPKRGHGVRRLGEEIKAGTAIGTPGAYVTPALVAVLAAAGVGHVVVRPSPRVAVIATGDELVDAGRASQPGQVVDANSHALAAAAAEAGAHAYRIGICDDDPEALRNMLDDQLGRADLIVTSGGTGNGPGDMVRRILGRDGSVRFTDRIVVSVRFARLWRAEFRPQPHRSRPGDLPARRSRLGADRVRGAGPSGDPETGRRGSRVPTKCAGAPAGDAGLTAGAARVPAMSRVRTAGRGVHRTAAVRGAVHTLGPRRSEWAYRAGGACR